MWKYIKKSSRNFLKHPVFLVSCSWPFLFLWVRGHAGACSSYSLPTAQPLPLGPQLEPGQEEAAGAEGDKFYPEHANSPPWPHAHALMAHVPLSLAQLPGGQWAWVSGR